MVSVCSTNVQLILLRYPPMKITYTSVWRIPVPRDLWSRGGLGLGMVLGGAPGKRRVGGAPRRRTTERARGDGKT
uniref:Protein FAR1-RELATED SEQUENCE 4 n=1 Tax=Rhizophora mucronata TaxID=61149 RepID=A0A2P2JI65_RHIMU